MQKNKFPLFSLPCNHIIAEYELEALQFWLIKLRWLAGIGVIAATWAGKHLFQLNITGVLYLIGIGILGYNLWLCCWTTALKKRGPLSLKFAHNLSHLQIGLDWLAMVLLVHYSGGIESPAILYFLLHIVVATIILTSYEAYTAAAIASILILLLTGLEYSGLLPHHAIQDRLAEPLYQDITFVSGTLFFVISTIWGIVFLTTKIAELLRNRENEVMALNQNLDHAYNQMKTLNQGIRAVNSTLNLQEVLDRLTRETTEAMVVKGCIIRLLDHSRTRLNVTSAYGLSQTYLQKGDLILASNLLSRQVIAGETIVVDDVLTDTRLQFAQAAADEGIRSSVAMPIVGRDNILGLIRIYCNRPYRFTDEDRLFLSAIANYGSTAIENAIAYQALQNLEEAKRKFILMVTHELRSPVGVVRSLLRTLTGNYAGKLEALQLDLVERALRRADFLQTLIDDLLELAANKTGLIEIGETYPVNLKAVLEQVVERYRTLIDEKQINYQQHIDSALMVRATTEEIDRAFNNLISNAVKYTSEGGQVSIALSKDEMGNARLEVSDSGIGIPADALPHLFEEFYRAPNAKSQVKEGTGLGLVVTKNIITRYDGQIQVQSKLDHGTTFIITLPTIITDI